MSDHYDETVAYINSQPAPNNPHKFSIGGKNSAFEPRNKPVNRERKSAFRFLKFLFREKSDTKGRLCSLASLK